MKIFNLVLTLLMFLAGQGLYAQKTNYVGLNFTLETSSRNFQPGIGLLFERKFKKNTGLETGLYFRTYELNSYAIINDVTGSRVIPFYVSERNLSIPVLYKFYTRYLNISAGPTFDFFLGWKQKHKSPALNVDDYNVSPNIAVGAMAKLSKSINLSKQFILEPELRYNYIIPHNRSYTGFGIAVKRQL